MSDVDLVQRGVAGPDPADRRAGLPGDPSPAEALARMLRVDHAGEVGAERIYAGQLAVLGNSASAPLLQHMAAQEKVHRATFDKLLVERRVRPSALLPLWQLGGYALGAVTALMGPRAAMACTVAVEEVIDEHYTRQVAALAAREPELAATMERFRREEVEHRDTALAHGAVEAPGYPVLSGVIKGLSRLAIRVAERV